jgi:Fur family ferric uptake transcriptional regulator
MSSHSHEHVVAEDWRTDATARLSETGHRAGGARTAVVELLAGEDCCLTANEIFDALRAEKKAVGLASVYRALDVLLRLGLVYRLDLGGGKARYEAARAADHHHHIVCLDCGRVSAFDDKALERALDRVAERQDYVIDDHDVVLRGRCTDCRAA